MCPTFSSSASEHATRGSPAHLYQGYSANSVEGVNVLKNSSMLLWSPDQGLKDLHFAVCWPWFGSVEFIFDLPTGQIATFSTGWRVLRSAPFEHHVQLPDG
jgi:hypothetical protein